MYPTIIDRVKAAPVSELPVSVLVPSVVLEPISDSLVAYTVLNRAAVPYPFHGPLSDAE